MPGVGRKYRTGPNVWNRDRFTCHRALSHAHEEWVLSDSVLIRRASRLSRRNFGNAYPYRNHVCSERPHLE